MSAITGIIHFNNEPVSIEHGTRLMSDLQKYPADDIQIWRKENVFLGCHAQWITPESVGEQLPFYNYEKQLAITADAIIDNRNELFDRLQVNYDERKVIPDSKLILLAYQKWGEDSPKYLVGNFAFMIWDERNQKLFGARDFSGSRTLYYYYDKQRVVFCTTISPLLALPYIRRELNEQWIAEYLAISTVVDTVDTSITPYKKIEQVPPAHSITIDRGKMKVTKYCTLDSGQKLKLKTDEEYVEAFQEVFQQAVTSCTRTYRQIGAHLSGGLDSGAVVSFAVKVLSTENKQLHTFSYIPSDDFEDYTPKSLMPDERGFIQPTVQYVGGIKAHYLDFKEKNSFSEIDSLLEMMEVPYKFFENSFWLKGMYEKGQEEKVGVILSGARGNLSISWGAALDYYAILLKRMKWFRLINELHQYSKNAGGARLRRIPVVARVAFPFIDRIFPIGEPYEIPSFINKEFAKRTDVFNKLTNYGLDQKGWFATTDIYEQRIRHFEDGFHWNATSTLGSKLSLPYSLWTRDPTNDIRVIRFCLSVPEKQFVQSGMDRALIRRATEKYLPDKVRLNQRIRGVQGADWLHRMIPHWDMVIGELQQLSEDERILEFIDGKIIKRALSEINRDVRPEYATDPNYKILMRSLILYRFMKKFV